VPQLSWDAFKAMNARYIFSAVRIELEGEEEIMFLKSFESQDSFWKIWLYKVK